MRKEKKNFIPAFGMLAAFSLWTAAVCSFDRAAIGPQGTTVGFAAINKSFHSFTGVHMPLYVITDLLSLVPLFCILGLGLLGLMQWIRRRSILKVDRSLLLLGGFYLTVAAVYVLFEVLAVNYRPVLIEGRLEASYPSSTTMLDLCVMPTTAMQLRGRIKGRGTRRIASAAISVFTVFMMAGRLVSGVHWLSDIVGGVLLSVGLVLVYRAAVRYFE